MLTVVCGCTLCIAVMCDYKYAMLHERVVLVNGVLTMCACVRQCASRLPRAPHALIQLRVGLESERSVVLLRSSNFVSVRGRSRLPRRSVLTHSHHHPVGGREVGRVKLQPGWHFDPKIQHHAGVGVENGVRRGCGRVSYESRRQKGHGQFICCRAWRRSLCQQIY